MADIFLDPVGGNDASDGLTFATRKRTVYNACQAATPGSTVKLIASPDPISVGSASWTDNSKTIAWTNNANKLVEGCDAGWVGVTNTTVTHSTSSRKTGSAYLSVAIASAFVTGKAAYKTLPAPLTLSSFQQIVFWFRASSASAARNIKIALCSDTTGDVIEASLDRVIATTEYSTSVWIPIHIDFGAALPGTAINSIAIYLNADPGSVSLYFDGFIACKAPGAADLIDYYSLIGKDTVGEPEWYPIFELSESGAVIGGNKNDHATTTMPYRGPTESVATYIRNPLVLANPWVYTGEARLTGFGRTLEGGYNRTDMSTKTGETWLSGGYLYTGLSGYNNSYSDADIKNIGFAHCEHGFYDLLIGIAGPAGDSFVANYEFLGFTGCVTPFSLRNSGISSGNQYRYMESFKFSCTHVWGHYYPVIAPDRPGVFTVGRIHGQSTTLYAAFLPGCSLEHNPTVYNIGKIDNNKYALDLRKAVGDVKFNGTVIENNTNVSSSTAANHPAITYSLPYTDGVYSPVRLHLHNMADLAWDSATDTSKQLASNLQKYPSILRQTKIGGDPAKNRVVVDGHLFFESNQAVRHTASGYSWRFFLEQWMNFIVYRPEDAQGIPLTHVIAEAGKQVTVTCWINIEFDVHMPWGSYSATPAGVWGIMIMPDAALGLSKIQVPANTTIIGSWQQVTLTFTPTADGVVPIYAYGYGSGDALNPPAILSAYYDDVEVTQEA